MARPLCADRELVDWKGARAVQVGGGVGVVEEGLGMSTLRGGEGRGLRGQGNGMMNGQQEEAEAKQELMMSASAVTSTDGEGSS